MKKSTGFDFLLNKFLDGKSTPEEKFLLHELIKSSENENIFKEKLFSRLNEFDENSVDGTENVDFGRIYGNILEDISKKDSSDRKPGQIKGSVFKRAIIYGLSMAAVSVVAFFVGSFYSGSSDSGRHEQVVAVTFSEITAPYGSKSDIILPDSSHVILNAGSTIRYRSDFNTNNRDIDLTGEAYFKVAKNASLPLIVTAGNLNVKAIGTEFNIKAYHDESFIETTLIEGKVEISQLGDSIETGQVIDLNPNQKAIYIKESDSYKLEKVQDLNSPVAEPVKTIYDNILISPKVDINQVVAWTKGKLIIKGESLDNLCIELQRKYDVSFVLGDEEISKYRFTGVLLDETLEQVLNVIKLTAPIAYRLEGKTVILNSDKTQLNDYSKHLK